MKKAGILNLSFFKRRFFLLIFLFPSHPYSTFCQERLHIDTAYTQNELVDSILVGNGIRVDNVKFQGLKIGMGYFNIDTNVIGMKSGILLSTGNVFDVARPNQSPGTTGFVSNPAIKYRSDRDLNRICRGTTYDQVILEFDFVPFDNHITFQFCFASEEYTEYVGSKFNDVFAFIVTGQGVGKKNLAVIPGTKIPITINTINQNKNSDLFVSNDYFKNYGLFKSINQQPHVSIFKKLWAGLFYGKPQGQSLIYEDLAEKKKLNQILVNNFEYDGFTKTMTATCYVVPWTLYHLKIAIGDVGDKAFDSGVFLKKGSFISYRDTLQKGFKDYPDLYSRMNWDSIFHKNYKVALPEIDSVAETEDDQFQVSNINFDVDKFDLSDTSKQQLDKLAVYLLKNKKFKCQLRGFTDNTGSKKHNQKLSENRAVAVMHYLTDKGIEHSRLNYIGNSFENPIATNNTENGRALNRRVEIVLLEDE